MTALAKAYLKHSLAKTVINFSRQERRVVGSGEFNFKQDMTSEHIPGSPMFFPQARSGYSDLLLVFTAEIAHFPVSYKCTLYSAGSSVLLYLPVVHCSWLPLFIFAFNYIINVYFLSSWGLVLLIRLVSNSWPLVIFLPQLLKGLRLQV